MRRTAMVGLLIGTVTAGALFGQTDATVHRLSLSEALARAVEVNNSVERARAEISAADASRRQVLSSVLPRFTASGSTVRNSNEVAFGGDGDEQTVIARNDWNYRLVLSQPVFAGRREFRAYSQARIGVESAQLAESGTTDAVLLLVASNYLAMLNAGARIELERRNVELAEKRRHQAKAFFEAGEVTKVDILRAETAIKAALRGVALAEQTRENAASRLRADLDLDGSIVAATPVDVLPPLPDEATLVQRGTETRPDVRVAENDVRIASLEVQKQRGFWWPVITFDGGWINQKAQFPSPQYSYGALRFTVPILQSGEVEARVAQAKHRELQARLSAEEARTEAREDVRRALADLRAIETSLRLAQEQVTAAEAEYNQAFELYRAQEATSLDVAISETSLADARRSVAEETLNYQIAQLRVWYAAGAMREVAAKVTP
ncbi:MAG TPA: TolC family protein [Thermoanaerobaculia bacterium]|nr:TolC family protein [Thermoanaerobaculia bacterium]